MSAESPRHTRSGGPLTVPSQPPSDRSIIDTVSGFINDVTLSNSLGPDPKDTIQWARFETTEINEPIPEGDSDNELSPLLLILGYGAGVQVWLIPPTGEAQEVLSWRQGTVRVLRILPTPYTSDSFAVKRPLIALCDSASPGPTFCSLSFISVRGGEQVKSIKFKNPILDVLANKRSVVVSFSERFAVFDAGTLEDRLAVTTCYPCPCPLGGSTPVNPLALGDRWLAYADKKLNSSKRSSGGCEGEGVTSYTATVLHAAKSLSKGLRGLGESVASSLAGGRALSQSPSPPHADLQQPGVVTILDIEGNSEDEMQDSEEAYDPVVAHFVAHSDAIIALKFDSSGMLLLTADRRGHDFHVFRIHPHPCGPALASVHHLYILHRGDTTAKVQDMAISPDSRWTAVSTLRGTTHVFPISPYGGTCGVRTHTQPRVVNRLSRFHRSAGLPIHSRSSSPVGEGMAQGAWFPNPRLPPYPLPTTVLPLAQLRPTAAIPTHTITRNSSGRQRLSSLSEENGCAPLLARARWGAAPAVPHSSQRTPAAHALYLMAANGSLLHYVLHPRPTAGIPKEKVCDDTPIELDVEPVSQWPLQRPPAAADLLAPLPPSSPLLQIPHCRGYADVCMSEEERWLAQVEIVTHAGPHRRLWMGPQFVFKTYNSTGSSSSLLEAEAVEVDASAAAGVARSNPVNMPGARPLVPVLIDSGSASSLEHSPSDSFRRKSFIPEGGRAAPVCDVQLKEDLAEAMKEEQGWPRSGGSANMDTTRGSAVVRAVDQLGTVVVPATAPLAPVEDPDLYTQSNSDETLFRPVVRAPTAIPPHPELVVRPLPVGTRIPVQTITPSKQLTPENELVSLQSDVVIPAALRSRTSSSDQSASYVLETKTVSLNVTDKEEPNHKVVNLNVNKLFDDCKDEGFDVVLNALAVKCTVNNVCTNDKVVSNSKNESVDNDAKCKSLPNSNQVLQTDIQLCNTKISDRKIPTLKSQSDKIVSEDLNFKIDKEVSSKSYDDKPAEILPRLPTSAKDAQNKENKLDSDIKTEEQAWDMLSTEGKNTCVAPVETLSNKLVDEVKPKSKRNRKMKTKMISDQVPVASVKAEIHQDLPHEETVENNDVPVCVKLPDTQSLVQSQNEDVFSDIRLATIVMNPVSEECATTEIKQTVMPEITLKSLVTQETYTLDSFKTVIPTPPITAEFIDKPLKKFTSDFLPDWKVPTTYAKFNAKKDQDSFVPSLTPRRGVSLEPELMTREKDTEILSYSEKSYFVEKASDNIVLSKPQSCAQSKVKPVSRKPAINDFEILPQAKKKEFIVINSMPEEFPDIKISYSSKVSKKISSKPHNIEPHASTKAPKSWSSIAATSKTDQVASANEILQDKDQKILNIDFEDISYALEPPKPCKVMSLQEKLAEICKRTDIVVAECDAPEELNFVDEHHLLFDLPPLEPLDFALDGFKLDVMHDSLLDVDDAKISSPICKINIDDILSTIKDTASRPLESSSFNLVAFENVAVVKSDSCHKDFSVVESEKFTTREVNVSDNGFDKLDAQCKGRDIEIMEKSSDDDNTSPVSSQTESDDKDDKKNTVVSSLALPSQKSVGKKKARRKRK